MSSRLLKANYPISELRITSAVAAGKISENLGSSVSSVAEIPPSPSAAADDEGATHSKKSQHIFGNPFIGTALVNKQCKSTVWGFVFSSFSSFSHIPPSVWFCFHFSLSWNVNTEWDWPLHRGCDSNIDPSQLFLSRRVGGLCFYNFTCSRCLCLEVGEKEKKAQCVGRTYFQRGCCSQG